MVTERNSRASCGGAPGRASSLRRIPKRATSLRHMPPRDARRGGDCHICKPAKTAFASQVHGRTGRGPASAAGAKTIRDPAGYALRDRRETPAGRRGNTGPAEHHPGSGPSWPGSRCDQRGGAGQGAGRQWPGRAPGAGRSSSRGRRGAGLAGLLPAALGGPVVRDERHRGPLAGLADHQDARRPGAAVLRRPVRHACQAGGD